MANLQRQSKKASGGRELQLIEALPASDNPRESKCAHGLTPKRAPKEI